MGILTGGLGLAKVASSVVGMVTKAGHGVLKLGGKVFGSLPGKFLLGAGVAAVLTSDPTKEGGIFNTLKDGFKSLTGKIGEFISDKAGDAGTSLFETVSRVSNNLDEMARTEEVGTSGKTASEVIEEVEENAVAPHGPEYV